MPSGVMVISAGAERAQTVRALGMSLLVGAAAALIRGQAVVVPAGDEAAFKLGLGDVEEDGQVPERGEAVPGRVAQQQVVAFCDDDAGLGRDDAGGADGQVAAAVEDGDDDLAPGLEALEDGVKAAHVERVGRALVETAPARVEDGVVEVEAVHRDEGRLRAEPGDERLGERGLACAGSAGDSHENATGRGPRKGPDPRNERVHQAATASLRGFLGTGHEGHRIGHGVVLGVDDAEAAAEAVDVDAVCHFEHVGHVVADQDDRQAAALHVEDQFQHAAAFLDPQRRGRFVHDDDLGPEGRGAGHRHALTLAAREGLHRLPDVLDRHQTQFRQLVARALFHRRAVEHPEHRPHDARVCGSRAPGTCCRRSRARERARGSGTPSRCRRCAPPSGW